MTAYNFGDVILVPFPFTDQSQNKQRPAVIVSSSRYHAERHPRPPYRERLLSAQSHAVARPRMTTRLDDRYYPTIWNLKMDISITDLKARCFDVIRKVEKHRTPVTIRRRGKAVARLEPAQSLPDESRPWEQLRSLGGVVRAAPGESILEDEEFEAQR